jgi:hypothetical protein
MRVGFTVFPLIKTYGMSRLTKYSYWGQLFHDCPNGKTVLTYLNVSDGLAWSIKRRGQSDVLRSATAWCAMEVECIQTMVKNKRKKGKKVR